MSIAPELLIVEIGDAHDRMQQAWEIRRRVFIEEQHVPEEIELDADDSRAFHVLALEDGRPVGCGRMLDHGAYVKIGRMAVVRERRGAGVGRRILEFLIESARRRGVKRVMLDAQVHAEGFYRKQGFTPMGDVFEEAGILHRRMQRTL